MTRLFLLQDWLFRPLERLEPLWGPVLARFVFAAVLLQYFWASGLTKLGDGLAGIFNPSFGAYAQIFPRKAEALGYDPSQFSTLDTLIVLGGTWAEFVLPLAIVIGLLARVASLGMIGFVVLQSLTDVVGHGADASTIGGWFDRASGSLILDQRAFWVFVLLYVAARGAGAFSLDRQFGGRQAAALA